MISLTSMLTRVLESIVINLTGSLAFDFSICMYSMYMAVQWQTGAFNKFKENRESNNMITSASDIECEYHNQDSTLHTGGELP